MPPTIWIINQFAGTPKSGWGERHFYLSQGWLKQGYRVIIISSGRNHMFSQAAKMKGLFTLEHFQGVDFFWVWTPKYNPKSIGRFIVMVWFASVLLLLPFYRSKIGVPRYIILSSMSIFPVPVVYLLKKIFKSEKFIFEVRDLWPLTPIHLLGYSLSHPLMRIIGWLESIGYRKSDTIVSVLKESKKYISNISGDSSKFKWIPNGINDHFLDLPNNHVNSSVKIPANRLVIGYVGTLGFANALDPFFNFIAEQGKLRDQLFFMIVGDGYLMQRYMEQVEGVDNVAFTGKVPKELVPSYLNLIDTGFISWHESELYSHGVSANKYFDYFAACKPVLSAQTNIIDPVVLSGCGTVIANDIDSIRNGVKTMLRMHPEDLKLMGEKGYQYVSKNHRYSLLSDKYLRIMEE